MSGYNKCAKGEEVEEVYFTLILLLAQLATAGTSPDEEGATGIVAWWPSATLST